MADPGKPADHKHEHGDAGKDSEMREGTLSLPMGAGAVAQWLENQVAATFDALKANPARAVSAEQVRQRLASEHIKARSRAAPLNKE
jgi:antitoxin ParD1/3/4